MSAPNDDEMSRVDDGGDIRRLAARSGDLHGELIQRIPRLVGLSADERERHATDGLADLRAHGLLTDGEVLHLTTIYRSLRATDGTPQEKAGRVAQIHQELVTTNAGPAALAVASIASNSISTAARLVDEAGKGADIGDFSTTAECACAGAIVGATAGAIFGPAGVLAGAAAGAAGGAIGSLIAQALKS